jgi:internalin A
MLIDRLDPAATYSVAIKTRNSEGTGSHLPNVAAASLPPEAVVAFPDSALNARIREVIQKPSGDIHTSDLANLLELEGNDQGIVDLTGLQACAGLQILHVMSNRISDLTPLAGLFRLRILGLNANQVSDVAPIRNLVNLTQLSLGSNQITDLWWLRNMTKVETLHLSVNQVSDIGHLRQMLELTTLQLQGNQIGGIRPLGGMTKLQYVQLDYNRIGSLLPLLENTDLGQGDEVFVAAILSCRRSSTSRSPRSRPAG